MAQKIVGRQVFLYRVRELEGKRTRTELRACRNAERRLIMATKKKSTTTTSYSTAVTYEKKLERVMARLKAEKYSFNYDRLGTAWVEFKYKGNVYRFDHSIEKAKLHGITLKNSSDAFAQIVLSLEDLARMVERGIYDLQVWVSGMKFLQAAVEIPSFLKYLSFVDIPKSEDEVKAKYKEMAMIMHPDKGGNQDDFTKLQQSYEKSLAYVGKKEG
jgi:hypothetical protein